MSRAQFAYTQARLQARHGMRPQEAVWRRLASTGDLANYLQAARHTVLQTWIEGIQTADSSHALEVQFRQQFRRYVESVAHWVPPEWRASIFWVRHLPDLPVLQFLLQAEAAPAWLQDDPDLHKFVDTDNASVVDTLRGSDHAYLAEAWLQGTPLYDAWFEQWQRLWPTASHFRDGLVDIGKLIRKHIHAEQTVKIPTTGHTRDSLAAGLNSAFRRYSFKPAAACAHLGLVALDLERLRGELAYRALFTEISALQA